MPIPANLITHAEIITRGIITAGGSNTKNTVTVYHYRRTTVVNPLSKPNLDTVFDATVTAAVALALNNRWTQSNNSVRWIDDALDAPAFFNHAAVGAVAGDGMTTIEAAFLLLKTGLRGKSYRGSKHYGPLSEADCTAPNDDIFNAAALARMVAIATALGTALVDASGNTWVLQVVSTKLSQLLVNPTTVVANDVTTIQVNKRVGRLKRREAASVY
jgi:hypothetical protein